MRKCCASIERPYELDVTDDWHSLKSVGTRICFAVMGFSFGVMRGWRTSTDDSSYPPGCHSQPLLVVTGSHGGCAHKKIARNCSLVDIALEAVFTDQAHFSRMFKSAFGLTPMRYRVLRVTGVRDSLSITTAGTERIPQSCARRATSESCIF
jgi:AraC-like DNA-binding protein